MIRRYLPVLLAASLGLLAAGTSTALDQEGFEKNLTIHRLDNGLTLMIYQRPIAPVISVWTYVDVGSAQEVPGITGLAHMFEHMAFKGTDRIGTTDYREERKALAKVDRAYHAYDRERRKPGGGDPDKLAALEEALAATQEEAGKFVVKNEFADIIDREGGTGMNAGTGADSTEYMMSLPANKLELWAYLESERFLNPVFREFYMERDVVMEERRMRTESQPVGRMVEQFLTVAFMAHPYGQPGVGYMSDLQSLTREDAREFYEKHYVPGNMTVVVVGHVDAETAVPLLAKYFGRLPAGSAPEPLRTVEPEQIAEKTVVLHDPAQPIYIEGYHRPAESHADDAVYNAIADILSTGRTSRLYRRLVSDDKTAVFAGAFNGFPGSKYPNLMIFLAAPSPGNGNDEVQKAIREEIDRIVSEPVSDEELNRVKTRAKAGLIRGLTSNSGIAGRLATAQARHGDWRVIFRDVEEIERVTKEDIRRVAAATFIDNNRTVVKLEHEEEGQ